MIFDSRSQRFGYSKGDVSIDRNNNQQGTIEHRFVTAEGKGSVLAL